MKVIPLGKLATPLNEERLLELAQSNYLGINTAGCTLALDGQSLLLKGESPYIEAAAAQWKKVVALWEESA